MERVREAFKLLFIHILSEIPAFPSTFKAAHVVYAPSLEQVLSIVQLPPKL